MSENMNEEANTNILMTEAEEATSVESQDALQTGRRNIQFPLLLLALIGLGFAANHVWANRAEYKAMVGLEDEASKATCSLKAGSCGSKNLLAESEACSMKGEGQCPLMAGQAGCSSEAGLVACTGSEGGEDSACCTKMSAALAAAMLKKTDKELEIAETEVVESEVSEAEVNETEVEEAKAVEAEVDEAELEESPAPEKPEDL